MEKYSVSLDEAVLSKEASKEAQKDGSCPKCSRPLVENNQFLMWCLSCGTEPFEKKPAK